MIICILLLYYYLVCVVYPIVYNLICRQSISSLSIPSLIGALLHFQVY